MKITLDDLKGKALRLRVVRKIKLDGDDEPTNQEYGILLDAPKTVDGQTFQYQGYVGPRGKRFPVLAQVIEDPGVSAQNKPRPALRLFRIAENEVVEYAVGFRYEATGSKKVFYSGHTTLGAKADLTFFTVEKAEEPALEAELVGETAE